nr:MAG TPA: Cell wall hydrolase autolysin [Caudoviricetes sp.]
MYMAKWLLDPGHGGSDPGACYNKRRESDDVLRLSRRVGEILSSNGESVSYTRTSDATVSLSQRSSMENRGAYDYFVSIHRNAIAPEKAKGVETHIYSKGGKKEELATKINNNLVGIGFVDRKVKVSNFHVLRETKCAAILIECGFIDHTSDNNLFDSKFEQMAQAIAKGCLNQVGKNLSALGVSNSGVSSYTVKITANVLNVRAGAGTNYKINTSVKRNEVYTIVETKNNWGKLKSGAGWICLDYTIKK